MKPTKELFVLWQKVRDGTISRRTFRRRMQPIRQRVDALHDLADSADGRGELLFGDLQDQLVVDLEDHAGFAPGVLEPPGECDHGQIDEIGGAPWIVVLTAARSACWRALRSPPWISGK